MRLIDADELGVGRCNPDLMVDRAYAAGWNGVVSIINNAPTVDAAPVVHGRWKPTEYPIRSECEDCSECGYRTVYGHGFKFCPNCGAKMDLE